jgi:hypothetical protein
MKRLMIGVLSCLPFLSQAYAQNTVQQELNDAIALAERVCLVGDRYRFKANASGGVTISRLLPGGKADVLIDQTRARGSQFFDDEAVRRLVDDDIRKCMSAEWPRVMQTLQKRSLNDTQLLTRLAGTWCLPDEPRAKVNYFVVPSGGSKAIVTTTVSLEPPQELTGVYEAVNGAIFGPASLLEPSNKPVVHVLHVSDDALIDRIALLGDMRAIQMSRLETSIRDKEHPAGWSDSQKVDALIEVLPDARQQAINEFAEGKLRFQKTFNFRRCG